MKVKGSKIKSAPLCSAPFVTDHPFSHYLHFSNEGHIGVPLVHTFLEISLVPCKVSPSVRTAIDTSHYLYSKSTRTS